MSQAARRRSLLAAAALGLSSTSVARAEPAPAWLAWSAPAECQNTPEVERRLASLLGRPVDVAALPATEVRMGWSAERGWAVRVTVQLEAGPRERALDAPSCADAFDVVALSLALILDPSFEVAASPDDAPPLADEAAVESRAAVLVAELEPLASTRDASPPLADSTPRADPDAARASAAARSRLIIGAGPLTDLGVFPVPQFGGGVQLGLAVGRWRVELEGDLLASESARFTGAQYPVNFHTLYGALRGCYTLALSERLGWVGCAGAQLGTLGTREGGGDEHRAQGLWLAAEAATGPEFAATSWMRAFARVRGVSPLYRHEFLLSEGSRVHALPWFSPQLQVGVTMDVTDFGADGH